MGIEPTESIPARLQRLAAEDPDRILIEEVDGASVTRAQFHEAVLKVADALVAIGIKPGDCVVTMFDNCIRAQAIWLGTCWAGAMEVPVNPEFRGNSLVYAINDCRAPVVICSQKVLPQLAEIRDQLPHVRRFLTLDDAAVLPELENEPLAGIEAGAPRVEHRTPAITDPYAVIYTSGTTGASKGVVCPWGSLQFAQRNQLFSGDDWSAYEDPTFYSPWPCFHSSGRTGLTFAIERGGRLVMRPKLSTSAIWNDMRRYRCTHTHLLGVSGWLMSQAAQADDADNPCQRILMNPVIEDFREFEQRFGVSVTTGWGMTEIGFPMAAGNLTDFRTCGKIDPIYEAKIIDDDGNELGDGEAGELLIRSDRRWLFFTEYLNKPKATAASWDNGWYRTGDILRREGDGSYYFVDRKSDYMRVNGNNVSSVEVETEARLFPGVEDAAAVAISASEVRASGRQSSAGEDEIRLMVKQAPGAAPDPAELIAHLERNMARYMVPRFVEFVDDFPRTPTGKIQKKALRSVPLAEGAWERPTVRRPERAG